MFLEERRNLACADRLIFADFVEEEHAAGGQFDLPGLGLMALVKAPRS